MQAMDRRIAATNGWVGTLRGMLGLGERDPPVVKLTETTLHFSADLR